MNTGQRSKGEGRRSSSAGIGRFDIPVVSRLAEWRPDIQPSTFALRLVIRALLTLLGWAAVGVLAIAAMYQIPAAHEVAVGFNDAAYVQGFADPSNRWGVLDDSYGTVEPFRRSTALAALLFPQIGLPAEATLRWRSASNDPLRVRVLQGDQVLADVEVGPQWSEQRVELRGGLFKPNDVALRLVAEPPDGLLLSHAALRTTGWPIVPYPAQLAYGGVAVALGALLFERRRWRALLAGGLALAFLLLYRQQLTPYPLRMLLPGAALLLALTVAVRALPRLSRLKLPAIAAAAVLGLVWLGWSSTQAASHLVQSLPGVERDFAVFASRAASLACPESAQRLAAPCVLRADGYYQLGYPFLLWAAGLTGGATFVAARWVALGAGFVLLAATWALGVRLHRAPGALLAVALVALSPVFVQYSLSLGTDMPFAALWTAALAALLAPRRHTALSAAAAGLLCGLAFVVRHPGLVLLPFGVIALWFLAASGPHPLAPSPAPSRRRGGINSPSPVRLGRRGWGMRAENLNLSLWFVLAWLIAVSPQLLVNLADTGELLYNRQAKNIWLALYADIDYSRWNEAGDTIRLADLVLADPARFVSNWGRNLKAFVATGGEDTSEFGRALGLRLLGFPANVLGSAGVVLWLWRGGTRERLLVLAGGLYVAGVAVGFALPRFFVPIVPLLALAAVTPIVVLGAALGRRWVRLSPVQWRAVLALTLLVALAAGPRIGARYVLERQDPAAAAITAAVLERLAPGAGVRFELTDDDMLDDVSAIAGLKTREPATILVLGEGRPLPQGLAGREPFAAVGQYRAYELR